MDEHPSAILIIILVILIILSMLFSISESSILGMNKLRLRILRQKKNKKAVRVSKLLEKREQLINTLLISNDLVNIFVSSLITSVALSLFGEAGVGYATITATILLLIFGEITPKTISTRCPDRIAYGLSGFVKFVYIVMHPIVIVVTAISRFFLRFFGIHTKNKKPSYTEEEIKTFFDLSSETGIIEEDESRMLNQVFKFSDLEAQDIMVPRTKIWALSENSSYRDVIELSQRVGFTRFPIYRKSIDDIVGILYLKDMLAYKNRQQDFSITELMREPVFILGTQKISSVQNILFEKHQSMAIIVDEYSGTDGVLTEKDISREIFAMPGDKSLRGKVFDFDSIENKNNFTINGLVLLQVLKKDLHINLESKINETIGGWFTEKINRMPQPGDTYTFEGWNFTVIKIQSNRIERIQLTRNVTDEEEEAKLDA